MLVYIKAKSIYYPFLNKYLFICISLLSSKNISHDCLRVLVNLGVYY